MRVRLASFLALALASCLLAQEVSIPEPGPKDSCPVCGMFVAPYPEWLAAVHFRDGTWVYFDGARDLFRFWLQFEKYAPGRSKEEVEAVLVTEYYDLETIEARGAKFVVGSDVLGPMGHELIPHLDAEAAKEYLQDHEGQEILDFDQVDLERIEKLEKGDLSP